MFNRFMITAATAALIAGTGFANAQGTGGREGGPGGGGMQQSAPSSPAAAPSTSAPSHEGPAGMKAGQSEQKGGAANRSAQQDMKSGTPGEKPTGEKSAQDTKQGDHAKGITQNEKGAAGKDMKAEDERNGSMKAEGRENNTTAGAKEERSQTVGQAGGGAKLSTEQRTKITTVIRDQHVSPVTNINFSVSVGTRVPRDVGFHPLPTEIVTIYPEWRGYEFFLVREQIVVVDPRTLEIIAVLDV
jgi:hypothetical protein